MEEQLQRIHSSDAEEVYIALKWFRHELSREASPPIAQVVATGVTPLFVQFMESHPQLRIRMEAAWCLTNIASGDSEMIEAVEDAGAIPAAIQIVREAPDCEQRDSTETVEDLRDQCVWLLSNLAGEGPHIRDTILALDGAEALRRWMLELSTASFPRQRVFLDNGAWACSNMVRGEVSAYTEEAAPLILQAVLPIFSKYSAGSDASAIGDSLWCICYIARIPDVGLSLIKDAVVRRGDESVPLLNELIAHVNSTERKNVAPSLRAIGEFGAADSDMCAYIVEHGAVPSILRCTENSNSKIRKEAWWILSNIALDSEAHAAAVLSQLSMRTIVSKLRTEDHSILKEILYLLTNLMEKADAAFMRACAPHGVIPEVVTVSARLAGELRSVAHLLIQHALHAARSEEDAFGLSPALVARLPEFAGARDPRFGDASDEEDGNPNEQ